MDVRAPVFVSIENSSCKLLSDPNRVPVELLNVRPGKVGLSKSPPKDVQAPVN
ncbi:MAG: hypothetical protein ACI9Z9_000963 [Litorivivens sp.]|jgi:hypothetical protein